MSRSHLSWAQTGWFVQATVRIYSEVERTTPSAPFKRTGIFFDGAATPPLPRRGFFASYRFILNSSTSGVLRLSPGKVLKISPSKRCFRRYACLLRRPQKVPADLRNIFAIRKKFLQTCETFSPSEKSLCRRVCLLKHPRKVPAGINTFYATGKFFVRRRPRREQNSVKPKFKASTEWLTSTIRLKDPLSGPSSQKGHY